MKTNEELRKEFRIVTNGVKFLPQRYVSYEVLGFIFYGRWESAGWKESSRKDAEIWIEEEIKRIMGRSEVWVEC